MGYVARRFPSAGKEEGKRKQPDRPIQAGDRNDLAARDHHCTGNDSG